MLLTDRWSSKFYFIAVSIGVAIGLGNIWRFPTMVGLNGGGAFVSIYLLALVAIGVPLLTAEMMLGRMARQNVSQTFQTLSQSFGASKAWKQIGVLWFVIMLIVLAIYSMIAGWICAYLYFIFSKQTIFNSAEQAGLLFDNFIGAPGLAFGCLSLYLFTVLFVVQKGLHQGIERAVRWLMPVFLGLIMILLGYACLVGDVQATLRFMFWPDFSQISPKGILEAISHACYTLTVGRGVMLVYGAYTKDDTRLGPSVLLIALIDTVVAIAAGFIIFPILFAHGLSPDEGPGLIFKTLPIAFGSSFTAQAMLAVLFGFLFIAAFSSSIAQAEPMVLQLRQWLNISRAIAVLILGVATSIIGGICVLSFNYFSEKRVIFSWNPYQTLDNTLSLILLPLSLICLSIFAGWIIPQSASRKSLNFKHPIVFKGWHFCIRYLVVLSVVTMMVVGFLL